MYHRILTLTASMAAMFALGMAAPAHATTTDTTPPSVPQNLYASPISSTSIGLSWATSTDDVGVAGYHVFRNDVSIGTTAMTNHTDTGLTPSTSYIYKVDAFDMAGNTSSSSASATATTSAAPDTTAPSVPTGLVATAVSSSQITLTWSTSTDAVGVAGYRVYQNSVQVATAVTTSYAPTGLMPSTAYTFFVAAYDVAGNVSLQSAPASATTFAPPSTDKFMVGDRVFVTTNKLNVRKTAGGKSLGFHRMGDQGIIIGGPVTLNALIWWNIDYDTAPDGWSAQDYLEKVVGASAAQTPPQGGTMANTQMSQQLASVAATLQGLSQTIAGPTTPDQTMLSMVASVLASLQTLIASLASSVRY